MFLKPREEDLAASPLGGPKREQAHRLWSRVAAHHGKLVLSLWAACATPLRPCFLVDGGDSSRRTIGHRRGPRGGTRCSAHTAPRGFQSLRGSSRCLEMCPFPIHSWYKITEKGKNTQVSPVHLQQPREPRGMCTSPARTDGEPATCLAGKMWAREVRIIHSFGQMASANHG